MTEQTNISTDHPIEESAGAPGLISRVLSHGSTLVMGTLLTISAGGLYAMHLHTKPAAVAITKTSNADAIGPQTVIAFQHAIAETRRLVESVQKTEGAINSSHYQIGDPFAYVRQRPPEMLTGSSITTATNVGRDALKSEVARLNLQSILCGRTNYCLVNNELFTEGQMIGKFVIDRITSEAVHVRSGDFVFELRMNRR